VVTVEVDGLGALTNTIVDGHPLRTDVGAQPSDSEEVVSTALGGDWEHRGERAPQGPGARHYRSELDA
jgi:5-oxopent-3-ene-1,2,5-tricarboxylate decarboxylase/2-hydroxyhepta-2,4-diene-1,7-dioate isomerase